MCCNVKRKENYPERQGAERERERERRRMKKAGQKTSSKK
jgi:hypothetical protein